METENTPIKSGDKIRITMFRTFQPDISFDVYFDFYVSSCRCNWECFHRIKVINDKGEQYDVCIEACDTVEKL